MNEYEDIILQEPKKYKNTFLLVVPVIKTRKDFYIIMLQKQKCYNLQKVSSLQ